MFYKVNSQHIALIIPVKLLFWVLLNNWLKGMDSKGLLGAVLLDVK